MEVEMKIPIVVIIGYPNGLDFGLILRLSFSLHVRQRYIYHHSLYTVWVIHNLQVAMATT